MDMNRLSDVTGEFYWFPGMYDLIEREEGSNAIVAVEDAVNETRRNIIGSRVDGARHFFYKHYTFIRSLSDVTAALERAYATVGAEATRMRVTPLFVNRSITNMGSFVHVQNESHSTVYTFNGNMIRSDTEYVPYIQNDLLAPDRSAANNNRRLRSSDRSLPFIGQVNYANVTFNQTSNTAHITRFIMERLNILLSAGVETLNTKWSNLGLHALIIQLASTDRLVRKSTRYIGLVGNNLRPCDADPNNTRRERAAHASHCENPRLY